MDEIMLLSVVAGCQSVGVAIDVGCRPCPGVVDVRRLWSDVLRCGLRGGV